MDFAPIVGGFTSHANTLFIMFIGVSFQAPGHLSGGLFIYHW